MRIFKSIFAKRLKDYVKLRQYMGFSFKSQAYFLLQFDRFVFELEYVGQLTQNLAIDFAFSNPNVSKRQSSLRYQVVRHFSDYLAIFEPDIPKLPILPMSYMNNRPPVHIFTDEELTRLLREAKRISRNKYVRGFTLFTIVGLVASTGLRIGEVVRLDQSDVNLKTGILVVRQTKFRKDRLVPVHPTTLEILKKYSKIRDVKFPECKGQAFFINTWRRRFSDSCLRSNFKELLLRTGIKNAKGIFPRFHDLRHTFAVKRLIAWYREGKDVQAKLPTLATYLGHVSYSETAYYLTATTELMGLTAERFQEYLQQGEGRS